MEFNKSILLLLLVSSSLLLSSTEAICVPRDAAHIPFKSRPSRSPPKSPPSGSGTDSKVCPSPEEAPPSPPSVSKLSPLDLTQTSNNADLQKICGITDHPEVCLTTIAPFLKGGTDPDSVLKVGIQALSKAFELGMSTAEKLMKDPSTSTMVKGCLDTCIETFDNGLSDLESATNALNSKDMGTLKTMLSAAISDVETCKDAFLEEPGVESPLKDVDQELSNLASNNMAISTTLKWQ